MKEVIILLSSLVAGGLGYLIVTFWINPILRYIQIRHDVTSDLVYYANVISPDNLNEKLKEKYEARIDSNRRHAAEMAASYYRLPRWYRAWLKKIGEEPLVASKNLIGLSNCNLDTSDHHIQWLKKSLLLDRKLDI